MVQIKKNIRKKIVEKLTIIQKITWILAEVNLGG